MVVDRDHLARLHVADKLRPHDAERAGLAAEDIAVADAPDGQRPEAVLVPHRINPVVGHHHKRKSPFNHIQGLHDRDDSRAVPFDRLLLDEVGQDLAVGCGLEKAAAVLQVLSQLRGIDHVAVVDKGEVTAVVPEEKRLDILDAATAMGGVAHVADRHISVERSEILAVEDFGHEPESLDPVKFSIIVDRDDSAAFLAAMLKGMETVVGHLGGVGHAPDTEHPAFFFKFL